MGDAELPLTWSATEQSALKLNMRHLCLFGAWPLSSSRMYHVYSALTFALGVWYVSEAATSFLFLWGDMEEATLVLISTFNIGSIAVKLALFARRRRRLAALARGADGLALGQRGPCGRDPRLAGLAARARRAAARLTAAMLLLMVAQYATWFPMPLLAGGAARRLPLAQHPWDNNSHHYALSYAAQCAAGAWMTQISFGIDCLFVSIMILLAAQIKILASRVAGLKTGDGGSSGKQRPSRSPADHLYRELCDCVQTHQQLLRFVKELENAMSPIVMTQFACSVLVTCVTLFPATYVPMIMLILLSLFLQSTDFSAVIRCAGFLPVPLGQLYLYCWAAHTVSEQAEAVSAAAYRSAWVGAGQGFRRALLLVMGRAQKPLVLTAGRLYPINRAAFVSLVNASYTYYALLCQINKRSTQRVL